MIRIQTVITGGSGGPYYSSFYFNEPEVIPAQDLHDAVADFWDTLSMRIASGNTITTEGVIEVIDPATGAVVDDITVPAATTAGAGGAAVLMSATQGLINWKTNTLQAGRRVRGKTYIPGVQIESMSDNRPTGSYQTFLQDAGNTLVASAPSGAELVIYSPTYRVMAPVTSVNVSPRFAVLRSRRD